MSNVETGSITIKTSKETDAFLEQAKSMNLAITSQPGVYVIPPFSVTEENELVASSLLNNIAFLEIGENFDSFVKKTMELHELRERYVNARYEFGSGKLRQVFTEKGVELIKEGKELELIRKLFRIYTLGILVETVAGIVDHARGKDIKIIPMKAINYCVGHYKRLGMKDKLSAFYNEFGIKPIPGLIPVP